MSRKRTYEDVDRIDNVDKPMARTSIHGAITLLSPVKKGRNSIFFDGTLADETSKIRLVGFDAQQQRKLSDYQQKNVPVQLVNCEVKSSRYGEGYEVMLKSATQIQESPKKIDVPALMVEMSPVGKTITLDMLPSLQVFEKVTVNVKVLEVKETTQVGEKMKQDVYVGDQSGTAKVCVWEQHVNSLEEGKSYCLRNFTVREYQGKYLSMPKEGSEIENIDDIGSVVERHDETTVIKSVTIIGVSHLDKYKACLKCKARVEPLTPPLGRCSSCKCMMMQRYDICHEHETAKLMLMHENEGQKIMVQCYASGEVVREIAGGDDVTPQALLNASKFKSMTLVKEKNIVKEVEQ